jgi:hypothetical protein
MPTVAISVKTGAFSRKTPQLGFSTKRLSNLDKRLLFIFVSESVAYAIYSTLKGLFLLSKSGGTSGCGSWPTGLTLALIIE